PNGGFAVCQGRKQTLPVGLCSLMTTGLFGSQAKREIARVMTAVAGLESRSLRHLCVNEWVRTQIADRDVRQVVLTLVRHTTYCTDPARLSAEAAMDQLQLSLRSRVLFVHNGWASLIQRLETATIAAGGMVVRGTRVRAVETHDATASHVIL